MNKAKKGSAFENLLLKEGLSNGMLLGLRGASSKSRSPDEKLKVDLLMIKGETLYIIQSKNWKTKATKDKKEFSEAIARNKLEGKVLKVKSAFIQSKEELSELLANK